VTTTPPEPDIRTYDQLINRDFRGGQANILLLRNLIKTMFNSGGLGPTGNADEISIKEFPGYDPTAGLPGTAHLAINAAWDVMKKRGRSRVVLPPGNYRLGAPLNLTKDWVDARRCELVGAGPYISQIVGPPSTDNIINVGSLTAAQSGNVGFRGFSIAPGAVQTGYAMAFENCRTVHVSDVTIHLAQNAFGLGKASIDTDDQVEEIFFDNVGGSLKAGAGSAFYDLGCVQQLHIRGGRSSGRVDQHFIKQTGTVSNTDGLYLFDHFSELWGLPIYSTGNGIVNFVIDIKQFDRATTFLTFAGAGSYRHGMIKGQFLGGSAVADETHPAFLFDSSLDGSSIENITVHNSMIYGHEGPAFKFIGGATDTKKPEVLVNGNYMVSCGTGGGGVPVNVIDANSNPSYYGNSILMGKGDVALDPFTYGFDYAGSSTGRRNDPTDTNTILDFATGAVNGTP
jgi:hypothetical protein